MVFLTAMMPNEVLFGAAAAKGSGAFPAGEASVELYLCTEEVFMLLLN